MPTTAEIADWRDALIKARLAGIREVRDQNGETVVYKSDSEMAAAIADAERRIAGTRPTIFRFSTSKGI